MSRVDERFWIELKKKKPKLPWNRKIREKSQKKAVAIPICWLFCINQWSLQLFETMLGSQPVAGKHKAGKCWRMHILAEASTTYKSIICNKPKINSKSITDTMHVFQMHSNRWIIILKEAYRKRPRKLLLRDQSTRPTQLPIKKGNEIQEGWLIPTTNWTAGSNKQHATLRR